jgi:hypothetical protein
MKKVLSLLILTVILTSAGGINQENKLYKKGYYYEVIKLYESHLDNLTSKQTLQLAHSYYETKSFFKAKVLYYQVQKEQNLSDMHKLALADILLSTGMFDLAEELLFTCEDKEQTQFLLISKKVKWARQNKKNYSNGDVEKVEKPGVASASELTTYFDKVISEIQINRGNTVSTEMNLALSPLSSSEFSLIKRTISGQEVSYVRNSIHKAKNGSIYSVKSVNVLTSLLADNSKARRFNKRNPERLKIQESSIVNNATVSNGVLTFCNDAFNYVSPFLSGDKLYFSSDRPGGFGGYDLYYVQMNADKTWGEPINLGATINSNGNEMYPMIITDRFYFSSDGLPGFGGVDLFFAPISGQNFQTPINMGSGVNSGYDDFGFIKGDGQTFYFVSNRDNLYGLDEVFQIQGNNTNLVVSK